MTNFTVTVNGSGFQAASASTAISYSTARLSPAIELESSGHAHVALPHVQHHMTVAVPRFAPEPLNPLAPADWIAVVPFAMIVVAYLSVQRACRFLRAQHPV